MKVLCCVLIISLYFCSCTNKEKRNSDILPGKQMTDVMWDLVRADQFINDFVMKDSAKNRKEESIKLYEEIFRLHHITAEQFKKSQAYYESNPLLYRPIIDSLTKKQIASSPAIRPIAPDSIFQ